MLAGSRHLALVPALGWRPLNLEHLLVAYPRQASPILDLYVGSLQEVVQPLGMEALAWTRLTAAEADLLRRCTKAAFLQADSMDLQAYRRILDNFFRHRESLPQHSWIGFHGDAPVGACLVSERYYYSSEQGYPYIDLVAIDAAFQGRGFGHAVLRQSLCSLRQAGYKSVVHAHIRRDNARSVALFTGHGFFFWRRD